MGPNDNLSGFCNDKNMKGLIPRVVDSLFESVETSDINLEFTISVQYIEIYMEKIKDLLDSMKALFIFNYFSRTCKLENQRRQRFWQRYIHTRSIRGICNLCRRSVRAHENWSCKSCNLLDKYEIIIHINNHRNERGEFSQPQYLYHHNQSKTFDKLGYEIRETISSRFGRFRKSKKNRSSR